MKAGIIGFGKIGHALYLACRTPSFVLDPFSNEMAGLPHPASNLDEMKCKVDLIFICVPTPTDYHGECDDSIVLSYVEKLADWPGLIVVKSTIPPSSVRAILKIRPATVIWPEFVREAKAWDDMVYPSVIAIGASSITQFIVLEKFIRDGTTIVNSGRIISCSPEEASIFKYAVNTFLATKVAFFHQLQLWMKRSGKESSYAVVTDLLRREGRIGNTHLDAPGEHGYGYAGSCFPKDVKAFVHETGMAILTEVDEQNERLRGLN